LPESSPVVQKLWLKMYEDFVEAIDGIDNGVTQYESDKPARYKSRTDLSARVGALNPRWNETFDDAKLDEKFQVASALTGSEFLGKLNYLSEAWLPARSLVKEAFDARFANHPSGKVIVFDSFAPWKEHLFEVEREEGLDEDKKPVSPAALP
jgi:uncharacterized UPF0160 family protein